MDRLDNPVRPYPWGSARDIPEFRGVPGVKMVELDDLHLGGDGRLVERAVGAGIDQRNRMGRGQDLGDTEVGGVAIRDDDARWESQEAAECGLQRVVSRGVASGFAASGG